MKYFITDNGIEKEVSKKHYNKINLMHENVQRFFVLCEDYDLNKRYSVTGFDLKLKGIDILYILDIIYKDRDDPTRNLTLEGNLFYHTKQGKCVGWNSSSGFVSFT